MSCRLYENSPLSVWLSYIRQQHGDTIQLGLERIALLSEALRLTHPAPMVFVVGGTNGKGTTCRTLETIFLASNYRVGVYSSPHLLHYTERVRIQGKESVAAAHSAAFACIEQMRLTVGVTLTYFEYITLAALQIFKQATLDVVILEVGLGGSLDAVNVVDGDVAILTTIDLDHTERLGGDREVIGHQKAGIFRAGRPAVVGDPAVPQSVVQIAKQLGSPLFCRGKEWDLSCQNEIWSWCCGQKQLKVLPVPRLPLPNAATALTALHCANIQLEEQAIVRGLQNAYLPGRFQIVQRQPDLILDVAHNPQAAAYLAVQVTSWHQTLPRRGKIHGVVGMMADKDIAGVLSALKELVDYWYCAPLGVAHSASVEQLLSYLPTSATPFTTVVCAWGQAMHRAQPQDIVIVFGSFHAVAPVMQVLNCYRN